MRNGSWWGGAWGKCYRSSRILSILSKHSGKTGWRRKASGLGLEGQLGLCRGREFRKGSRKYSLLPGTNERFLCKVALSGDSEEPAGLPVLVQLHFCLSLIWERMILATTGRVSKNNQGSESKIKILTTAQAPEFRQMSGLLCDPG